MVSQTAPMEMQTIPDQTLHLINRLQENIKKAEKTHLQPMQRKYKKSIERNINRASVGSTAVMGAGLIAVLLLKKPKTERFIFELPLLASLTQFATTQTLTNVAGILGTSFIIYKINRLLHAQCRTDFERLQEKFDTKLKDYHLEVGQELQQALTTLATKSNTINQEFAQHKEYTKKEIETLRTSLLKFLEEQEKTMQSIEGDIASTQTINSTLREKIGEVTRVLEDIKLNPIMLGQDQASTSDKKGKEKVAEKHSWFHSKSDKIQK